MTAMRKMHSFDRTIRRPIHTVPAHAAQSAGRTGPKAAAAHVPPPEVVRTCSWSL